MSALHEEAEADPRQLVANSGVNVMRRSLQTGDAEPCSVFSTDRLRGHRSAIIAHPGASRDPFRPLLDVLRLSARQQAVRNPVCRGRHPIWRGGFGSTRTSSSRASRGGTGSIGWYDSRLTNPRTRRCDAKSASKNGDATGRSTLSNVTILIGSTCIRL
jgi:hypothetical protein